MTSAPQQIVTGLWVGETLPPLAELSIRSFLDHGIGFRLYSYGTYENLPDGAELADANDIIPQRDIFHNRFGSLAAFGDWFRQTWITRSGGFWTDLDVVCLSGNLPQNLPWFARQDDDFVNVSVIGFDAHDPLMELLRRLAEEPSCPMPWDDPTVIRLKEGLLYREPDLAVRRVLTPWGNAGPNGLTAALRWSGRINQAADRETLYPLHYTEWQRFLDGSLTLDDPVFARAWAVHLWADMHRHHPEGMRDLSPQSILCELFERHGMPRFPAR